MTKVDKYLTKYLDGSITELEVEEFRELIESEPQLQTELRQILDLRSIVHDDLLALNPPEYLSRNVREQMGERFAALAHEEEEEERRRPWFLTERIAGSFVTAMVALVLVALAPTLIAPSGSRQQRGSSELALLQNRVQAPISVGETPVGNSTAHQGGAEELNGPKAGHGSNVLSQQEASEGKARNNGEKQPEMSKNGSDASLAVQSEGRGDHNAASADDALAATTPNQPASSEASANSVPDELSTIASTPPYLATMLSMTTSDPNELERIRAISSVMGRSVGVTDNLEASQHGNTDYIASTLPSVSNSKGEVSEDQSDPRIAFGFTVGAGSLTRSSSVALTQGGGYAAFNLSKNNRIGIEAGGSKFRYVHTLYSQDPEPFAKRSGGPGTEWNSTRTTTSGSWEVYQINGYGGGGTGSTNNGGGSILPTTPPGGGGDGEKLGGGDEVHLSGDGGITQITVPQPGNTSPIIHSHSYESDTSMGYGMFFYDRRVVALGKSLNIHSRVGLGGTDGGLIVDLRAYAAFATHENVAITVGIGGSALRELSKNASFNANYGVQVGAELGF